MSEKPTIRRFLRFGVRDLLWAMVVVGLVLALLAEAHESRDKQYTIDALVHQRDILTDRTRQYAFIILELREQMAAQQPSSQDQP
jgi:hypothetical protein